LEIYSQWYWRYSVAVFGLLCTIRLLLGIFIAVFGLTRTLELITPLSFATEYVLMGAIYLFIKFLDKFNDTGFALVLNMAFCGVEGLALIVGLGLYLHYPNFHYITWWQVWHTIHPSMAVCSNLA